MNKKQISKYLFLLITFVWSQTSWAENVGQVQYIRGAVIMQNMDGSNARLIAKNEKVQRGEVLITGAESFSIVKLNDGTSITIRQNSTFSVERFKPKEDSAASVVLRLFRGGMRAITGYISKRNPDRYKVKTDVTTLGIQGARFDVRLCQDDCEEENRIYKTAHDKKIDAKGAPPGFYVSVAEGRVNLKNKTGMTIDLKAGQSAYVDVLGRQAKKLPKTPLFQQFDAYPLPDVHNPAVISLNAYTIDSEESGMVCEIHGM